MSLIFFFNDTATTEIYTLSLHDALPILRGDLPELEAVVEVGPELEDFLSEAENYESRPPGGDDLAVIAYTSGATGRSKGARSEEHTSELQARQYFVCRLLLEKKNNYNDD